MPAQINDTPDELHLQALLMGKVIERILKWKANIHQKITKTFEIKPVSEFMKRMRVSSLEKFDTTTYISYIYFYASEEDMEKKKTLGVFVLYVEEEYIVKLLQRLDYPIGDTDDQELIEDAIGTFCNLIAGNFKNGLTQLGYTELAMSHFSSYRNEILNGVDYCLDCQKVYEVSLNISNQKRIVGEFNMGHVAKIK